MPKFGDDTPSLNKSATRTGNDWSRRALLRGGLVASLSAPAYLRAVSAFAEDIDRKIGAMFILGFQGADTRAASAKNVAAHIKAERASGAIFLGNNFSNRRDLDGLTGMFHDAKPSWNGPKTLLAVDQEGGAVQRLGPSLGFSRLRNPHRIARTNKPIDAWRIYEKAGREMRRSGFNINLAPSVDLFNRANPVIGQRYRAFSPDPREVVTYAQAFIEAFAMSGVMCSIKHFPGHGSSRTDSHLGFTDITGTWKPEEMIPFKALAAKTPMVMGGHLFHKRFSNGKEPVTFSKIALQDTLRGELGFTGVVVTDDLDMGAIRRRYSLKEAVIRSIDAGNNLLLLTNSRDNNPDLPADAIKWVKQAIADHRLWPGKITRSHASVEMLKKQMV